MFMKKLFYIFALVAFTLLSCNDNEVDINNNAINESSTGLLIKKVRKLENPYTVSNMKKAYSALQQEGLMNKKKSENQKRTLTQEENMKIRSYPIHFQDTLKTVVENSTDSVEEAWEYLKDWDAMM